MNQTSRIALVTGGSRGIGAGIARVLGQKGFRVVIHYRSQPELAEGLSREIPGSIAVRADLSIPEQCQDLIKTVQKEMGGLHVLVNNAGMAIDQILPFAKTEDFDTLVATNLKPVFSLCKFSSKLMIKQKWGRIVNITSVVGYSGNPGQSMYSATKAAITGMTKSMAYDLAPFGILANCVAPGFIETEMTQNLPDQAKAAIFERIPLKRMGTPEEVAKAVAFLASEDASYITGSTLHVNGGMWAN